MRKIGNFFLSFIIGLFIKSVMFVHDKVNYVREVFKEMVSQAFIGRSQRIPILLSGFHVTTKKYYKNFAPVLD